MKNLVEIKDVHKSYLKVGEGFSGGRLKVLEGVSFNIEEGLCVGLIGESGSGKSTLSRLILGLEKADKGSGGIFIEGKPVKTWLAQNRGKMSVVFQDYTSSVNGQFTVREAIAEPLLALGKRPEDQQIDTLLEKVGLPAAFKERYPHELSGGQLQRVCIARAIATNPRFIVLDEAISSLDVSVQAQIMTLLHALRIVLDEAISSLDVSVQAQIMTLLHALRVEMNMTYLFVAHDLQAVAYLCNKIVFLYKGRIVEERMSGELAQVQNPYAKKLLDSVIPFEV